VQRGAGVFRHRIRKNAVLLVSARLYVSALLNWYECMGASIGNHTTYYQYFFGTKIYVGEYVELNLLGAGDSSLNGTSNLLLKLCESM
jgi:hypothetical protein